MRYGYARVSTRGQADYGTSLDAQADELAAHGCAEVVREAYTGTSAARPALDALLARLEPGDELVVCKMDRVARSVKAGLELFERLEERGVRVEVLNMGVLTCTPSARMLRTLMLAVAEFERDCIVERTQAGLARRRASDPEFRTGPKEKALADLDGMREAVEAGELTVAEACRRLGCSRATWYRRVA